MYYLTNKKALIAAFKAGSSSVARQVIKQYHADVEQKIQAAHYPAGKNPDNKQWQGLCPRVKETDLPKLMLIREPVERFRSAMAQFALTDVDSVIDSLKNGTQIQMVMRDVKRSLQGNPHFTVQKSLAAGDVKLYRFPDHLEQFAADAGLDYPLPTINEAKNPKPKLTDTQRAAVLDYYAADKALYDAATEAGTDYTIEVEPEPVHVPTHISIKQLRLYLLSLGMTTDDVMAKLKAVTNAEQREKAIIEFETDRHIRRDSRLVALLAEAFNRTDEQMDRIFIEAAGL